MTVVVLANLNGPAADEICAKLTRLAQGEEVTLPGEHLEVSADPAELKKLSGGYVLAPNFVLMISVEGTHVYAQATRQPKAEIFYEGQGRFFYKIVDAQIDFKIDVNGAVRSLILHQNGRDMPATKKL